MLQIKKVVLITGSNKGLGFGLVEDILSKNSSQFRVIMTARDQLRGEEAFQKIKAKYPAEEVDFHLLDIEDEQSRINIVKYIAEKYGKIDILVNNAAYLLTHDLFNQPEGYQPSVETAKRTFSINLFGTISMTQQIIPYLADDGKILQISSRAGQISRQPQQTQQILSNSEGFSVQKITELAEDFYKQCENKIQPQDQRWSFSAYEVSKCLLNAFTRHVGLSLLKQNQSMYNITPGWVKTDMGTDNAPRTVEEGNDTSYYLISTVPFGRNDNLNCKFIGDRNVIDW
ncbi:oxidoreductase, short chain dehydrogenase/reductase family protein (macronuclear) [Tetrahymena thermophila SB210]|uniref:Oxidoreductase, short chain dehydrogenase/reductase family protein n=1 Tax=Tetrahymena thermophila (strain SB210) TaxID=312017 RepID=Q233Z6_TETTS|nr:oxidoreductase, short chain dehydrogenase/reductase family protein [Tetrahymena thermophila SB210]EAR92106.1 oxidoreductase, short chain dehydrogenase/reductase family protein [Tetrahymena thermophila SB210]|eukprot:XP_001012352.1 oxidoreductase, short chain dehydrogenase/reductase family protein [Tetrahymena thermophila SB210]